MRHPHPVIVIQPPLEFACIAGWQGKCCHLHVPCFRIRTEGLQTSQRANGLPCAAQELVAPLLYLRPIVLGLELNGRWHRQIGSNVTGAVPFLLQDDLGIERLAQELVEQEVTDYLEREHYQRRRPEQEYCLSSANSSFFR